jgi:hypothetical protein
MIVRVLGDGQFEVPDGLHAKLNEIDALATEAVERGDEEQLQHSLEELARTVTTEGTRLDDAHLGASDLIIPPSDLSLDEARELFSGEGLIPDLPV